MSLPSTAFSLVATPAESSGASEKSARSRESAASSPGTYNKARSCAVCRTRKVRCDKEVPCSNCRKASIQCVLPSTDRLPRWARRLERVANNAIPKTQAPQGLDPAAAQVMERLRNLEILVKDLRGQLEQANAAASPAADSLSGVHSPENSNHGLETNHRRAVSPKTYVDNDIGRLVLQHANQSRYVSSGFWSRINDELDGLHIDSRGLGIDDVDSSDDEGSPEKTLSMQELGRTPSERHAFLFRNTLNPSATSPHDCRPLPSQVPFLLDVFSENVNSIIRIVHIPTIAKMVRDLRGSEITSLTPTNEALLFSIYYAAVTSMEENDVLTNFGSTKAELNLKYRLGLEHALAKADFLNVPDLVVIQAFAIFLCLVRRHESPRFVWMMTGLLIRMGHALGLHRDGAHLDHLAPYEVEMRRRAWWVLCTLDVRASEDQGTEFTIACGSFDTKLPSNINDFDINSGIAYMPEAREGITDMTLPLVFFEICEHTKKMMTRSVTTGGSLGMDEQSRMLEEIYQKLDQGYLQYSTETDNVASWVAVIVVRLVMAKMTLLIYLPILFKIQDDQSSNTIKAKLLIAAIEVAEYNHALNSEQTCRHWQWVFQTYIHWYAVVYLLLEVSRRQWSPIIERAWGALQSKWLIPEKSLMNKSLQIWIPLRKLMAQAKKHRHNELNRLSSDPQAAQQLEMEDRIMPHPASPGQLPPGSDVVELFRERWRQLLTNLETSGDITRTPAQSGLACASPSAQSVYTAQPHINLTPSEPSPETLAFGAGTSQTSQSLQVNAFPNPRDTDVTNTSQGLAIGQNGASPGVVPWLWVDSDPSPEPFADVDFDIVDLNIDLEGDMDWYNWVQSAQSMEWTAGLGSTG